MTGGGISGSDRGGPRRAPARHACRVVVLSDTHAPRFWKRMPAELEARLTDADHVLHAGDVCRPGVLAELAAFAPVTAVQGNNDGADVAAWGATPVARLELAGVRIAMVHDSGQRQGRAARMHAAFPDADLVVFGHSHIPWHTEESVAGHSFILVNPGSPTDPRRQPLGSFVVLRLADGGVEDVEFVHVPRGAGRP